MMSARLEEKRKAIEAQKRRIEAIFTKHRQRLGVCNVRLCGCSGGGSFGGGDGPEKGSAVGTTAKTGSRDQETCKT
uniref:Uncharacterized protein n=1 Tax=Sinocyclocheilus rhinocerous TaxID=307959 RepID=A0A673MUC0_9TELE